MLTHRRRGIGRRSVLLIALFCASFSIHAQIGIKQVGDYYAYTRDSVQVTHWEYTEVSRFSEDRAWVNKGDLYGYIDSNFQPITEFVYTDVSRFQNGYAMVSRDSTFGFINTSGQEICDLRYVRVKPFWMGYAAVQDSLGWTLIDTNGVELFKEYFSYPPMVLSANFIVVCRKERWGVIDKTGKEHYPFQYDIITSEGIAFRNGEKVCLGLL